MNFSLNEFLISVSNTLDAIESDLFGVPTNHSKRIAYIATRIAHTLMLKPEEIFDLAALSLMHDNGATMKVLDDKINYTVKEKVVLSESRKEHCLIGEANLKHFPFLTDPKDVIKYHHEDNNGSGFFGLSGDDVPLFAQIIHISDSLDLKYDLNHTSKDLIIDYVITNRDAKHSIPLSDIVLDLMNEQEFWEDLKDENIKSALEHQIPLFANALSFKNIRQITHTLSRIIDAKSIFTKRHSTGLSGRMQRMAKYYHFDTTTKYKLLIASDLHDLGKLSISNEILDKPGKLTTEEFETIKMHPVVTRSCLQELSGLEDISNWAGNHHEKLDGSGYPNQLHADELNFPSRLMCCLDIYQALREKRPYRGAMNHINAMTILYDMGESGQIDKQIVKDINLVFSNPSKSSIQK